MQNTSGKTSILKRLLSLVLAFGPGIFAIGYTIGTGSVTSMTVAGSTYGMQLLWVLVLSCLFSGALIYAYGQYALVTEETGLYAFRKHLKWGKLVAILVLVGISFGQWNSLMGILGISSSIVFEILAIYFPSIASSDLNMVFIIAAVIIVVMYALLLQGKYTFFEKVLVIFVTIMGFSFLFSLFFVHPLPGETLRGLLPSIPDVKGGRMMVAAFVGTTMASATFLSRPLFVKGKGWNLKENGRQQKKDAIIAAFLVFIISGTIMAVACGALFHDGKSVVTVLDMVGTLEPVAGKFALTLFFFGTLSAGLSSIFPCLLIAPILLADYQSGELDTTSKQFKVITGIACLFALTGPAIGADAIEVQILSQVFNVFVLPLVVISILFLINKKVLMKGYRPHWLLNLLIGAAFVFACIISYNGIKALVDYF
ncbi:MAG: Nramp family divalent metal transporter [Muricauda sp.]|nr:Nramp family divalent metal transporter [Allomuricauda sp.]MBA4743724.1 Nramp family divalent metal transporter [Allomuricauda sp.]